MTTWAGIAMGAAGLAVGEAVLSRAGAASAVGGSFAGAAKIVQDFLSATVPGLPPKTSSTTSTTTSTTATTTTASPVAATA